MRFLDWLEKLEDSRFRLLVWPWLLVLCSLPVGCSGASPESEVYAEFKLYRVAVASNQRTSFRYFSKDMLEGMLESTMYSSEVFLPRAIDNTRRLYLYGGNIEIVHDVDFRRIDKNTYRLDVYYSNEKEPGLRRVGLEYIQKDDKFLIDGFDFYLDSHGDIPEVKIDDFSNLRIPSVEEILEQEDEEF